MTSVFLGLFSQLALHYYEKIVPPSAPQFSKKQLRTQKPKVHGMTDKQQSNEHVNLTYRLTKPQPGNMGLDPHPLSAE